jgi:hypothetical protein
MPGRRFAILSAVSAIICLVAAGLWVRMLFSWDRPYFAWWDEAHQQVNMYSLWWTGGNFWLMRERITAMPGEDLAEPRKIGRQGRFGFQRTDIHGPRVDDALWPWINCGHGTQLLGVVGRTGRRPREYWGFGVRVWPVALLATFLPAKYLRDWRRDSKRRRTGMCAICGYDLRESPQRCPECGAERTPA